MLGIINYYHLRILCWLGTTFPGIIPLLTDLKLGGTEKYKEIEPLEVGDFGKLIKGEHFALAARTSRKLVIAYEFP